MRETPKDWSTMSKEALLRAAVSFDGRSPVIGAARRFARTFLDRALTGGAAITGERQGDVLLVVSELVTNAVRHAPGPCTLALALHGGLLEIAVSDSSRRSPQPRSFEPRRIGHHGLEIVLALCGAVTTETTDRGKTVRAHLRLD